VVFARNEPVIVLSKEAPVARGLGDLPALDRIVVGVPEVPIGRYTLAILDRASSLGSDFRSRFEARVVSRELNVKQVLAKVALGEAQAGIVYRSDVHGGNDVRVIEIAPEYNVVAEYPIALTTRSANELAAQRWVQFVLSDAGQATLERFGFAPVAEKP
jgi:molybdate transport system substrate-binding protein